MEQIKRMLVTQRGFIVRSLRQVAESRAAAAATAAGVNTEERDRTLGNTVRHAAHKIVARYFNISFKKFVILNVAFFSRPPDSEEEAEVTAAVEEEEDCSSSVPGGRLCPMCEAAFPPEVDEEVGNV